MNIKFGITVLAIAITSFAWSQKIVEKAEHAYLSERFFESSELCSDAYEKVKGKGKQALKKKGEMAFKAAESFRFTEKFRDAQEWYDRCILLDYQNIEPEVYLRNAEMLMMMGETQKAIENYDKYLEIVPGDELAEAGKASAEKANEFVADKTRHIVTNEAIINKPEFDMAPDFGDRKRTKLYFSSSRPSEVGSSEDPRTGEGYMNIWVSELDKKGNWTEPYLVRGEGINTIDNEGTVTFDSRYKIMFFTRCPNEKKKNLGCDIWYAEAKGKDEWKEPKKMEGIKSNDTISVGHPATMDGKFLIFASDMPGGFGGRDLWYTTYDRRAETWSAPVNMGAEINTKGNEMFPSFGLNGDLIFATDGRPGVGGLDLFRASRVGEENKWEGPENMQMPLNSTGNDYALVEQTERTGFFTSERKSVNGEFVPDIFSYEIPPNLFDLKVNVTELGDKSVKISDLAVKVTGTDGSTWEGYTTESGSVMWDKKPDGSRFINEETSYSITLGTKEGYKESTEEQSVSTEGLEYGQHFVVDMNLIALKPIRLPEVRYPLNKWDLLVDESINSPDSLLFVYNMLQEYPGMVLQLNSHTDSRGSNTKNQRLSENRARACYKYLVEEKGIDPRRIVPVGEGENTPRTVYRKGDTYYAVKPHDVEGVEEVKLTEKLINSYKSKDKELYTFLHQLNRRTDAIVLRMDFNPESDAQPSEDYTKFLPYK